MAYTYLVSEYGQVASLNLIVPTLLVRILHSRELIRLTVVFQYEVAVSVRTMLEKT